jgi:hypothetical protein
MRSAWVQAHNSAPPCDTFWLARRHCREIRNEFEADAEYGRFVEAVVRWQTDWEFCGELRAAADAVVRGEAGHEEARLLLAAIAEAGPIAPPLYRGFAQPSEWEILTEYHVGARIDLALVSFTTDFSRACEFAWVQAGDGGTEIVVHLQEGAHAMRIDLLAPDEIHWREREWLSGGRFVVTTSEYVSEFNRVEIRIAQEGCYDAR